MTAAAALLDRCRDIGISITPGPDNSLAWTADADPPAEVLVALGEHRAELLELLAEKGRNVQ